MTILLDGKSLSQNKIIELSELILNDSLLKNAPPHLAAILIGDDPASNIYVNNKIKACDKAGILSSVVKQPAEINEEHLLSIIDELNQDKNIDGILVQLPLPKHINQTKIIEKILANKDVDGFHPFNMGRLVLRAPKLRPCTPYGIMQLLQAYQINLQGINATIIGVSNIVGRPLALELLLAGATVTSCHRKTKNLSQHIKDAELLISATGHMDLFPPTLINKKAIVIDVGIHRLPNGKLRGDLDFEQLNGKVAYLTPVPGGIGPMTVAALLQNTVQAALINRLNTEI